MSWESRSLFILLLPAIQAWSLSLDYHSTYCPLFLRCEKSIWLRTRPFSLNMDAWVSKNLFLLISGSLLEKGLAAFWHSAHMTFVSSSWTLECFSFMNEEKACLVFQSLQSLLYQSGWLFISHLWLKLPGCIRKYWRQTNKKPLPVYFHCQSLQTQWSIQLF